MGREELCLLRGLVEKKWEIILESNLFDPLTLLMVLFECLLEGYW